MARRRVSDVYLKNNTADIEQKDLISVSAKPEIEVLRTYRSTDLRIWNALGEFVDNSITSFRTRLRDHPDDARFEELVVQIQWDEGSEVLVVEDNAAGIPRTAEGWGRALKTGAPNPDPQYLSIHGAGMKAAGLWWSPVLEIESKHVDDDLEARAVLDLEKMISENESEVPLETKRAMIPDSHWTRVTLRGLNKGRSYPKGKTLHKVKTFLASMYRVFLRGDQDFLHPRTGRKYLRIEINGQPLSYEDPEFLYKPFWPSPSGPEKGGEPRLWKKNYELKIAPGDTASEPIVITGWMGAMAQMARNRAGIFLTFRGKGVQGVEQGADAGDKTFRPDKIFGSVQGQRAARLIGEFEVAHFGKSLTTDAVNWSPEEEESFIDALYEEIRKEDFPLYQMATNFRIQNEEELSAADTRRGKEAVDQASVEADSATQRIKDSRSVATNAADEEPAAVKPAGAWVEASQAFELPSGHKGWIRLQFKPGEDWLRIFREGETDLAIDVNYAHPFVNRFYSSAGAIEPIIHFAIAVAIAEAEDKDLSRLRPHLNRWLRYVGEHNFEPFRSPEDD